MTQTTCALGHDIPDWRLLAGTGLCEHCGRNFHQALRQIATLWPDLTSSVARGRTSTTSTSRVHTSTVSDAGDDWRPHVAQTIADVTSWLEFMHAALAETKIPQLRSHDLLALPVPAALLLLASESRRLLLERPTAAEGIVRQALALRGRAQRALGSPWVRRTPLSGPDARCLAEVEHDDPTTDTGVRTERCASPLYAIRPEPGSGAHIVITCGRFPREHEVQSDQWDALAEQLGYPAR